MNCIGYHFDKLKPRTPIDFEVVISEAFKDCQHFDKMDEVHKDILIRNPNNDTFYGDYGKIRIIFKNLICNALKFKDQKKFFNEVQVKVLINSKSAIIQVYDNGVGISKHICDEIYRIFRSSKKERISKGLGLYIVNDTIKSLDGEIYLASDLGIRTIFYIQLPNKTKKELLRKLP